MSVYFCIPSKRSPAEVEPILAKWRKQGYKIALWRDAADEFIDADVAVVRSEYPGYAMVVNHLASVVLAGDSSADWIVTGGDDTEPDPNNHAQGIAYECSLHFSTRSSYSDVFGRVCREPGTFGVMQPTGDRFAGGSIDRICGSPWMGREFCKRVNGGGGPFWPEYSHMFCDEELQNVAIKLGAFWQRPDLIHLHHHFMRESADVNSSAVQRPIPAHLIEANSPEHWSKYQQLYESRKAAGFPGHEPLHESVPDFSSPLIPA